MDGLIVIILLVWGLKSLAKRNNPKKAPSKDKTPIALAKKEIQRQADQILRIREEMEKKQTTEQAEKSMTEQVYDNEPLAEGQSSAQKLTQGSLLSQTHEGEDLCDPTLGHARLQRPVLQAAFSQVESDQPFRGSLPPETYEGEDLCDSTLGHGRQVNVVSQGVYAGQIGTEPIVSFSPQAIVQGVVMHEILSRPRSVYSRKTLQWKN